jgi:hypothetical protein
VTGKRAVLLSLSRLCGRVCIILLIAAGFIAPSQLRGCHRDAPVTPCLAQKRAGCAKLRSGRAGLLVSPRPGGGFLRLEPSMVQRLLTSLGRRRRDPAQLWIGRSEDDATVTVSQA